MNIFVSYSPLDSDLVAAIVSVLCANNAALACCDADSIRTAGGEQGELRAAITDADVVLVFWCHHSFTSYEVRKETDLALECGKDVLPLLLDASPLPSKLAGRRRIDFRDRVAAIHEKADDQHESQDQAERTYIDRQIASELSREYEDLLIMGLVRDIQAELAARFGPQ